MWYVSVMCVLCVCVCVCMGDVCVWVTCVCQVRRSFNQERREYTGRERRCAWRRGCVCWCVLSVWVGVCWFVCVCVCVCVLVCVSACVCVCVRLCVDSAIG